MVTRAALILLCFSLAAGAQSKPKSAAPSSSKKAAQPAAPAKAAPTAIFHTTAGDLTCELFPSNAPKTVKNFIGLASGAKEWTNPQNGQKMNRPLYDGTIFHRVIPNFMIQGGDPLGTGTGGPGYSFEDEFDSSLTFDRPGRLAMANSGPNTNGSQFFITEVPTPHLNGRHTIFGQCDDASVELVKKIARMPKTPGDRPVDPVKINHIQITGQGAPAKKAPAKSPSKTTTPKKG
ncbi:MAG TPA: peptidylprolyl isomerase [Candidatus Angelobacter sp.]|nr:peptidylprolyl isomerase [Candidatus Angelobacter sp.]